MLDQFNYRENEPSNNAADAVRAYLVADSMSQPTQAKAAAEQPHNYIGVAADIGNGMINEVAEHKTDMLLTLGESALAGAVFRLAPPVFRGAAVVTGVVLGLNELDKNAPGWIKNASTVVNATSHTAEELTKAHAGLEHIGGGFVELGVGWKGFNTGMYAPELYGAASKTYSSFVDGNLNRNLYKNLRADADTIPAAFGKYFADGKEAVNWHENPAWVQTATDAVTAKAAKVAAWGNTAMSAPWIQGTTGAIKSRAESVSSWFKPNAGEAEVPTPTSPGEVHPVTAATPEVPQPSTEVVKAAAAPPPAPEAPASAGQPLQGPDKIYTGGGVRVEVPADQSFPGAGLPENIPMPEEEPSQTLQTLRTRAGAEIQEEPDFTRIPNRQASLAEMAKSDDVNLRMTAARAADYSRFDELVGDPNPNVRLAVLSNPEAGEIEFLDLSLDKDPRVRMAVAKQTTSRGLMLRMADDLDPQVRRNVEFNPAYKPNDPNMSDIRIKLLEKQKEDLERASVQEIL